MTEIKSYEGITLQDNDVFSFLGIHDVKARSELSAKVMTVIEEIKNAAKPRLCYARFNIKNEGLLDLGFAKTESRDLAKNLADCNSIILVCATLGLEIDRLIAKYSRISPSRAVIFQAAGAAAIESVLDLFEDELRSEGLTLKPRFSCGYGDLALSLQRDIFSALGCERAIGVTLTDSLLMSPTKSVSAIIGVENGL
ncbi:MAG: Vitamin B12 dependent methionine synthase activation subunit [Ruminococcaceae bacterium]|nr:Vitamin B12 dependent methionine synthase activation subunit [Oscillospiraceae bacterium]